MPLDGSANVVTSTTASTVAAGSAATVSAKTSASGATTGAGKINKRTSRLSSLAEDACINADDAPYRARLHLLFAQIEKEFEALYLDNLNRKIKNL